MLTQLSTVKARLDLDPLDPALDALLTQAIQAVSARFDGETNRILARAENAVFEFPADENRILVPLYPVESIAKFELKSSEARRWVEQPDVEYLIAKRCVIVLNSPFRTPHSAFTLARLTYTGGYVLPGDPDPQPSSPGCDPVRLPADLEQAAIEQTVFWFQTRDKVGLLRRWPAGGSYEQYADPDLIPSVRAVLEGYRRIVA